MQIKRTTTDDTSRLREIALSAKRHLGFSDDWMTHRESRLTLSPEYVSRHEVYAACIGPEIVGFSAILTHECRCTLDQFWVIPEHQRKGIGGALFDQHRVQCRRSIASTVFTGP